MDPVEDILRFHRPLNTLAFQREVKRLRDSAKDPNWLYKPFGSNPENLFQGDILPFVPLPFVNADGEIEVVDQRAMLLSTTCDAVPGQDPSAVLAPVYPVSEFTQLLPEIRWENQQNALKSNTYARYMYLPGIGNFPDSYVDFSQSASVSTRHLERLRSKASPDERVRFSRLGWYFFNYKLGYYYSRVEDEQEIPRGG